MGTVPTGQLERELRKLYLQWIAGLSPDDKDLTAKINSFQKRSEALIAKLGGRAASLGALADFPAPKLLELSPYAGKVYEQMHQAAIKASILTGISSKDAARQMFNAGMDKSYKRLERLARTETVSAYWKNSWDSVADLPLIVMVWGSESGPRTCDCCISRDGYVVEDQNIRDHPNGRCTMIPTLRSQVKYKGTLQADGSVVMDPAWSKKPAITHEMKNLTPEEIRNGTLAAEQQRVALEKGMFDRKGNINAANGWTGETRKSWSSYTEAGGQNINQMLRDPKGFAKTDLGSDEYFANLLAKQADDLAELISKNQLTDDIVVARGVSVTKGFDPSKLKLGDDFSDPAFLSTTTNLKEAADFASGRGAGTEGWTFITKAPKGTHAINGADYQHEIIFKPGQPQKVVGIDHKTRTIYTEITEDARSTVAVSTPQATSVRTFGSQVDAKTLKARLAEGDWRFLDDRDKRSAALLQNDYRAEKAVKKVAKNLSEGKDAMDGVRVPTDWSKQFTQFVTDADSKYTLADVKSALEDAGRWLHEQPVVTPKVLYKGLDVPKDKIAKLFKEGASFDTDYSSFSTSQDIARGYGGRGAKQVIVRAKNTESIKVEGNPTGRTATWTKTKEHLVSGQGKVVKVVDDGRTVWVDVEF